MAFSDLGGDGDPAARLLDERHVHAAGIELERGGHVVAEAYRERLGEAALVAEAVQVELDRLRLEAEGVGLVLDARAIEVWLAGDRTDRRELVAVELDARDARVREGLEPCVMLRPGMPERDEFGRARRRLHGRRVPPRRGRAAPLPLRWRPRAVLLFAHNGAVPRRERTVASLRELFGALEAAG